MAKRFTDSEKWKKSWFRNLKPIHKCFWIYILDQCDHSGIWEIDFDLAEFNIGSKLDIKEIEEMFSKQYIKINENKWFIKDFIEFQYKCSIEELNEDNKAHKSIIYAIKKYDIISLINKAPNKPLESSFQGVKDKDKDKDKDTELIFVDERIKNAWIRWIKFKKDQHKERYKSIDSEQIAVNKFIELCKGNYDNAESIVNQSIAGLWKGLFELKNSPLKQQTGNTQWGA